MVRELRRLLIEPGRLAAAQAAEGRVGLRREEEHYLSRVLRLRPGEALAVIDGGGGLWQARRGDGPWLEALQRCGEAAPPPRPALTLALALPRQDVDLVWRMATELGIDRLQPLLGERSQAAPRREPRDRWAAIVREATEQCERLWLPLLEPLERAEAWLARPHDAVRLLATTRQNGLPALEEVLASREVVASRIDAGAPPEAITLAIGPEGGWSPAEERQALANGWQPISLGGTILRSGTAAVAGVSRLVAWRALSCRACCEPSRGNRPDRRPHDDGCGAGPHLE